MELTVSWTNRTATADSIVLYRADEPFSDTALPEPLATLGGSASSYTDTDVVFGKTYYYRAQSVKGVEKATSALLKAIATTYTGPGPQQLISGDSECGFFGEVSEFELDNPGLLITRITGDTTPIGTDSTWLKFYYRGKILYFPKRMFGRPTFKTLYDAQVTTGVKGVPKYPLNSAPTLEQYREEVIRGQRFIVRSLNGDNERDLGFVQTVNSQNTDNVIGFRDCEYTDLLFGVTDAAISSMAKRKLASYPVGELFWSAVYFDYTQQSLSGNYPLLRNGYVGSSAYMGTYYSTTLTRSAYTLTINAGNSYINGMWRPVLEWIGPAI